VQYQNVPFIVPVGAYPMVWIDWGPASDDVPCPVTVGVSRNPDEITEVLSGRTPMPNGNTNFQPTVAGLWYVVLKFQTPGSGDKLVRIAV
jgi:hypothetical protein